MLVYFELLSLCVLEEAQDNVKWTVTSNVCECVCVYVCMYVCIHIYIYIHNEMLHYRITTNFTDFSKYTLTMTDLQLCCNKNVHKDSKKILKCVCICIACEV